MKNTINKSQTKPSLFSLPRLDHPTIVPTEVEFEPGELALIMEEAAAGNQTLQEFMQQATREGLVRYRAEKARKLAQKI